MVDRRVVVVFGPPGAGKTTYAHTLGLEVYDRDDPEWDNDEARFRDALRKVGRDPHAQAVVIRTGATERARADAIAMCNATEQTILDTPASVCVERIRQRRRPNLKAQISGVQTWWRDYAPPPTPNVPQGATSRAW